MHAHQRANTGSGFTLIEVLMVLGIIGVVAAMALPRWTRSITRYETDVAARRLAADLAWAQSLARNTSSSQTVHFTGNSYELVGIADPDHPTQVYAVDLTQSPYRCVIAASTATDANGNITFDGYGATSANGGIVLQAGDVQRQVTIIGGSGGATISQ